MRLGFTDVDYLDALATIIDMTDERVLTDALINLLRSKPEVLNAVVTRGAKELQRQAQASNRTQTSLPRADQDSTGRE